MSDERLDENINEEIQNPEPVVEDSQIVDAVQEESVLIQPEEPVFIEPQEPVFIRPEEPAPIIKPRKKKRFIIGKIAAIVAGAVLFGGIAGSLFAYTNAYVYKLTRDNFEIETTQTFLTKSDAEPPKSEVADIVEECMPSIVSISNKSVTEVMTFYGVYERENLGSGSGIIIGKNETELLIVTNYHVVADSKELSVMLSHMEIPTDSQEMEKMLDSDDILKAQIKGYDSDKDLAVISVKLSSLSDEQVSKIKIATIGDSSKLRAGEKVIAIGNSLGYGQSVTEGIVSATKRAVTLESQTSYGATVTNTFIQTDAAINPGNSGGALLNMNGEVVGINSVKIAASGVEGMGYAIPISDVEEIIGELMVIETRDVVDEDEQGFLGITIADISAEAASVYGMPEGVFVESVSKGSAADKAGIKKGYIITKFDDQTVRTGAQLQEKLTYYRANEKKTITVQVPGEDGYTEKELEITLDSKKERLEKMEEEYDD